MRVFLFVIFLQNFYLFLKADQCTWENCPKWDHNKINLHFVPHTHDDMGWLKTVDQYYMGVRQDIIPIGVQYIINGIVDHLLKNPNRKFSYAETGYLYRWISDHADTVNQTLVKLVQNGQLELIGGGWTQADEACTNYVELIDMYDLGLKVLDENFGRCGRPKVAWQIDPFGHSREHANLAKMIGFEALYFWRQHYLEQKFRIHNKSLELNWHASDDNSNTLFTGTFYGDYCAPPGFNFDRTWNPSDAIVDNPLFEDYNVNQRLVDFMNYIKLMKTAKLHNHFLVLMGCDDAYNNAEIWFNNIDKLITHLNKNYSDSLTAFYSTPACYTQAVKELNVTWPDKFDDFYPYAFKGDADTYNPEGPHSYFGGYFTSKPAFKGLARKSSSLLQLTRQISSLALTTWSDQIKNQINVFERAAGTSLHHAAITGDSKEPVTQDYIYRLLNGWTNAEQVINSAMQAISQKQKQNAEAFPVQTICRNINESECVFINNKSQYVVTVHNGNGKSMETLVKIPLYQSVSAVNIADGAGNSVSYQIQPTFINPGQINNSNIAPNEISFMANVKPLGFQTYFLNLQQQNKEKSKDFEGTNQLNTNQISNGLIQLSFDSQGYLSSLTDLSTNKSYPIKQEFLYYIGYPNITGEQPSGMFVFRPYNNTPNSLTGPIQLSFVQGTLVNEARQIVSPWISQTIRLLPNKSYVEFEWTIGPIPIQDLNSKEVITRYTVNGLNSNGVFWTDANGRQLMKRIRDYAYSYQYNNTEPVAGNYFPINTRTIISDNQTSMAILTDRSHGCTSLTDGQVEIMLHRRDLYDDYYGTNEALNEPGRDGRGLVVRGKHWLLLGSPSDVTRRHRVLAYEMLHSPVLMFSTYGGSAQDYRSKYVAEYSGLSESLPLNLNLVTLKQLNATSLLLRVEHIFQSKEDANYSQPASLDVAKLFPDIPVSLVQETNLVASPNLSTLANTVVTLNPMDIKTFLLTLPQNNTLGVSSSTVAQGASTTSDGASKTISTTSGGTTKLVHSFLYYILVTLLLLLLF